MTAGTREWQVFTQIQYYKNSPANEGVDWDEWQKLDDVW